MNMEEVKKKIKREVILERINIIQKALARLEKLKDLSEGQFALEDNFAIAEHNLRYALEAVFDICGHILARIPGSQATEYKKMAIEMGKFGIVPEGFAEEVLFKMAGYRNRLTHFYSEISPKEIYGI